ncbi:MAG: hypothetical protein HQ521_14420 [Bacteroidetes bacterium]|nr:hypothetical protein [Bacteroidota bacterium]
MGSDQIWNTVLTGGFDDIYWGDFRVDKHVRKITYAASASENLDQTFKDPKCYNSLNNFSAISVRENELLKRLLIKLKSK